MEIVALRTDAEIKEFIQLNYKINKDYPAYIRPLNKDVQTVFDPKANPKLRSGQFERWLLRENGTSIGRIAAFYDEKSAFNDPHQATGGIGFFDCVENQNAANLLFDTAKAWLEERGMKAMDGPINFGERDRWWGLLVDGFDKEPNYCCNYNPPYYQKLFESYGFQPYFEQYTYARPVSAPLSERIREKSEKVMGEGQYEFRHMELKNLEKYAEDFRLVYNRAWVKHEGVNELSKVKAQALIKKMKPLIDERVIWFGYHNGTPISFFLMIPEFNQVVKYMRGKFNGISKLIFLWHKIMKTNRKLLGLVFGVDPDHQGKGVEGAMIMHVRSLLQENYLRYDQLEMNWIGSFNPKMIRVVEQVGASISKTHITYRKLFDPTAEPQKMKAQL